ncbi:AAA domain-containing protein [Planotetraspora phitsanulokensis]|uniref:Very short patch repair endonuclease n=1 Tax=Planotetraspora phitsanulokensis TaxID=575192 RepID=A0A8J3UDG6_9ACTN|nr:AAA domain-containing protein [Planotetraspora phitsanulokensis]GII37020.1 very short patch repair endonuclease [Planotetraspora phitsanulokensis]
MPTSEVRTATDPSVLRATVGLVAYLQDLVRAGRRSIRNCDKYKEREGVWWLADLPEGIERPGERQDGTVLVLDYEPRMPPPQVPDLLTRFVDIDQVSDPYGDPRLLSQEEPSAEAASGSLVPATEPMEDERRVTSVFQKWLSNWRSWAEAEQAAEPRRKLHREIANVIGRLSQHDDTLEVVLGVGLLSLDSRRGDQVQRHLVTVRLDLSVDKQTAGIIVRIPDDAPLHLEDRQFLEVEDGFVAERVDALRQQFQENPFGPLSVEVRGLLQKWHSLALDHAVRFSEGWDRPDSVDGVAVMTLSPALIVRERDSNVLVDLYQRVLDSLEAPGATAPLGLAQLVVDLEQDERLAWRTRSGHSADPLLGADPLFPLPANAAQQSVLERLQSDTAVVVQGPPGTGKTHTIANLLAALLARGKRVLVTSAKDQALSVVRDMLPRPLQELCVRLASQGGRGVEELERTITALSDRVTSADTYELAGAIALLRKQHAEALRARAALRNDIFELRESETVQREVAKGYSGTRADVIEAVQAVAPRYDWVGPFPNEITQTPPLTKPEALELGHLLLGMTPERVALVHQFLPDARDVPSPEAFKELVKAAAVQDRAAPSILGELLSQLPKPQLDSVEQLLQRGLDALHRLGASQRATSWDRAEWRGRALLDSLAGRDQGRWQHLHDISSGVTQHQRALTALSLRQVHIPQVDAKEAAAMVRISMALRRHLADGKKLGGLIKPRAVREAEPILSRCSVDGLPPERAEDVDAILVYLRAQEVVTALAEHWQSAGAKSLTGTLAARLSALRDRADDLEQIRSFGEVCKEIDAILLASGLRHPVRTPDGWDELFENIQWGRDQAAAQSAVVVLDALQGELTPLLVEPSPHAWHLGQAARQRDASAYEHGLHSLATALRLRRDQQRCDELIERLRAAHPALAARMVDSSDKPEWAERLADLEAVWSWGHAAAYCRRLSDPLRDQKLAQESETAEQRLGDITAELAAAEAWLHCLTRMTQLERQALQAYKNRMTNLGKGTSKRYAQRYRHAARDAMSLAQGAVPAWIMPLPLVAETIQPQPDSFDVVIVDEASQVRIDAAFLLWLAPHVIVVGDDQQCAPSAMGFGELKPIHDRLDTYLPDMRPAFRDDFAPTANLYTLLSARFPKVIRLNDHFRCMPEIIGWSSRQFYDGRLVPLRQFGADRLDPLRVEYVANAFTEGRDSKIRNETEAQQIVEKLGELFADPAYTSKTFGVVVLQGLGQIHVLERLISKEIGVPEQERRKLRVGAPADFQGDQRDVIILSMVVTDPPRIAGAQKEERRRFNVAASRARDQMWLFTSVPAHRLKTNDLRHSLLTWMSEPITGELTPTELVDIRPDVPHRPFDSLFEQRVFLRIRERGYHVIPQVPAGGGKRIDLVVTGGHGKLAVECDGREWHSTPERVRADIIREQELRRAGWEFWRLREGDFFLDPDTALQPLWRELELRGISPGIATDGSPIASTWRPVDLQETGDRNSNDTGEETHGTS